MGKLNPGLQAYLDKKKKKGGAVVVKTQKVTKKKGKMPAGLAKFIANRNKKAGMK